MLYGGPRALSLPDHRGPRLPRNYRMKCVNCEAPVDRPNLWPGMPLRHAKTKQIRCHNVPGCPHLVEVTNAQE